MGNDSIHSGLDVEVGPFNGGMLGKLIILIKFLQQAMENLNSL
jgi:hypothetical protein